MYGRRVKNGEFETLGPENLLLKKTVTLSAENFEVISINKAR